MIGSSQMMTQYRTWTIKAINRFKAIPSSYRLRQIQRDEDTAAAVKEAQPELATASARPGECGSPFRQKSHAAIVLARNTMIRTSSPPPCDIFDFHRPAPLSRQCWPMPTANTGERLPTYCPAMEAVNHWLTPVRTGPFLRTRGPSLQISVLKLTSTPETGVIALFGPGVPSNGTPRSRVCGAAAAGGVADAAPSHKTREHCNAATHSRYPSQLHSHIEDRFTFAGRLVGQLMGGAYRLTSRPMSIATALSRLSRVHRWQLSIVAAASR